MLKHLFENKSQQAPPAPAGYVDRDEFIQMVRDAIEPIFGDGDVIIKTVPSRGALREALEPIVGNGGFLASLSPDARQKLHVDIGAWQPGLSAKNKALRTSLHCLLYEG